MFANRSLLILLFLALCQFTNASELTYELSSDKLVTFELLPDIHPRYALIHNIGIDSYASLSLKNKKHYAASWMGSEGHYIIYIPPLKNVKQLNIKTVENLKSIGKISLTFFEDETALTQLEWQGVKKLSDASNLRYRNYIQRGDSSEVEEAIQTFGYAEKALKNQPSLLALVLYEKGMAMSELSKKNASNILQKAADLWFDSNQVKPALASLNQSALVLQNNNREEAAQKIFKTIATSTKQYKYQSLHADALNNMGLIDLKKYRLHQAAGYFRSALKAKNATFVTSPLGIDNITSQLLNHTNTADVVPTVNNLALALDGLGQSKQAEKLWEIYLQASLSLSNYTTQAQAKNNLGVLLFQKGGYDRAHLLLKEAEEIFIQTGNRHWLSLNQHNLGQLFVELGNYKLAKIHLNEALSIRQQKSPKDEMETLLKLVEIAIKENNLVHGEELIIKIQSVNKSTPYHKAHMLSEYHSYQIAMLRKNWNQAKKSIDETLRLAGSQTHQRLISKFKISKAEWHHHKGQFDGCIDILRKESKQLSTTWDSELRNKAYNLLGLCQMKAQQPQLALTNLTEEIERIHFDLMVASSHVAQNKLKQTLKQTLATFSQLSKHHKNEEDLFMEINRYLVQTEIRVKSNRNKLDEAHQHMRTLRDKSFALENSKLSKEDKTQLEQNIVQINTQLNFLRSASSIKPLPNFTLQALQKRLPADTLLIQFNLNEYGGTSWWLSQSKLGAFELPSKDKLRPMIQSFRASINGQKRSIKLEKALAETLLKPLQSFTQVKKIILVLDAPLNLLPFTALKNPLADYKGFLGSHIEIQRLDNTLSLLKTEQNSYVGPKPKESRYLIVADPVTDYNDPRLISKPKKSSDNIHYERLKGSLQEAQHISKLAQANVLTGFDANKSSLTSSRIEDVDVLHIATHGVFNPEIPSLSALVLSAYDKEGNRQPALLRAFELQNLSMNANLVVLSGCETGLASLNSATGLDSLSNAFLEAGNQHVISSLWRVSDRITARMMIEFYNFYTQGDSIITALSKAQATIRNNPRTRHPKYWSGWYLVSKSIQSKTSKL